MQGKSLKELEEAIEKEYSWQRLCQICEHGRLNRWRYEQLAKLRLRAKLEVIEGGRSGAKG
jgi:hypothetical protein